MTASDLSARLARRLAWHQALHDPDFDPRARSHWLAELRRWQAARLRVSFAHFLDDSTRAPAANFFLGDVYGDRDFTRRDADIARILRRCAGCCPRGCWRRCRMRSKSAP